jgi:hypothetical protein
VKEKLIYKIPEKGRLKQNGKDKSEQSSKEMCVMGDIIVLLSAHIPGIKEIPGRKQNSRDWD